MALNVKKLDSYKTLCQCERWHFPITFAQDHLTLNFKNSAVLKNLIRQRNHSFEARDLPFGILRIYCEF